MPLVLLNKPFKVLCQFTDPDGRAVLADYVKRAGVYPAGRLDFDSEGLLALTDDGALQARISQPSSAKIKAYWVQVEGIPGQEQLEALQTGIKLKDGPARASHARLIDEPDGLWPRNPPIRVRPSVPDQWLDLGISEGRNRQVRRMTAAVGLPTLRLIRYQVGPWTLDGLQPGECRTLDNAEAWNQIRL